MFIMQKLVVFLVLLLSCATAHAQQGKKSTVKPATKTPPVVTATPVIVQAAVPTVPAPKNELDSASYALGMLIGENLSKQIGTDFNKVQILEALTRAIRSEATLFTPENANQLFNTYGAKMQEEKSKAARGEGEAFLAKNKMRPGIMTTASGLQYEVLKQGTGTVNPKATDKVKVHYHGTLTDGTVFDSSVERGETISFGLDQVIKGWTEGVQLMKVGDKFRFYIPYDLAYGEYGSPPKIKPYAALVFEVELFAIE
jgi:FKBP-type peptidyl-prolyl cis-trans isomerase FklB